MMAFFHDPSHHPKKQAFIHLILGPGLSHLCFHYLVLPPGSRQSPSLALWDAQAGPRAARLSSAGYCPARETRAPKFN